MVPQAVFYTLWLYGERPVNPCFAIILCQTKPNKVTLDMVLLNVIVTLHMVLLNVIQMKVVG